MIKNLFVLRVNNYWPEICEYTIPTIKFWAKMNGWIYNEITERKYPDYPVTLEKTQIYELGRNSDRNLLIDADVMLRPDFVDPTTWADSFTVLSSYGFEAKEKFEPFQDDGRNLGMSGGFVLSSKETHELWRVEDPEFSLKATSKNPHLIDEQVISQNLALRGYPHSGVSDEPDTYIVHFGGTNDGKTHYEKQDAVADAAELWHNWSLIWPELKAQEIT